MNLLSYAIDLVYWCQTSYSVWFYHREN